MKIMLCGSMSFAKEMLDVQAQLSKMGHEVFVPCDAELHVEDSGLIDDLTVDRAHLIENNVMKRCFDLLAQSDSVVFLNYPKNGVDGYIGTSSLMEMGLAYYLGKEIFLLFAHPNPEDHRWAHEVASFQPTILHGDFDALNN
ncbi:MAG: hypothetical protein WCT24_01450 [Patescibacteria group bacterium]|jgi:nucleoside 2-deoxyribosyltransferase